MTSTISFRTGLQRILSSFSPSARSRIWRRHRHRPLCQARTLRSLLSEASSPSARSLSPNKDIVLSLSTKPLSKCTKPLPSTPQRHRPLSTKPLSKCTKPLRSTPQRHHPLSTKPLSKCTKPLQSSQQLSSAAPAYPKQPAALVSSASLSNRRRISPQLVLYDKLSQQPASLVSSSQRIVSYG